MSRCGTMVLKAELKFTNSNLTYESFLSKWVRAEWRAEQMASSEDRLARMMESRQLEWGLMEDQGSLWAERSSSSSSSDSQLTQPSSSEEREHMKVYLRIRPSTAAEAQKGESQDCVWAEPPGTVLLMPPSSLQAAHLGADKSDKPFLRSAQRFHFSQVYGPDTTQEELFQGSVKDLIRDVLQGGDVLLFSYGVTNAGKTFTFLGPDGDAGILPRSLDALFGSMRGKLSSGMGVKPHRCREFIRLSAEQRAQEAAFKSALLQRSRESNEAGGGMRSSGCPVLLQGLSERPDLQTEANGKFCVWVSFCEIYNEKIHDLLEAMPGGAAKRTPLRLSQDIMGNAFVKDLRWLQVDNADEAYQVIKLGKRSQSFASTGMNRLSSRSHSIFSIRVLRIKDTGVVAVNELCLCDLAGSERCAKTGNHGERLKEAGNINASLLILGKCVSALRHNGHTRLQQQHVPFRESKLTHLLQAFFCGRGKVCMMVNVNRCASAYDETLRVLEFSALAQKVILLPSGTTPVPPRNPHLGPSAAKTLIGQERGPQDTQEEQEDDNNGDEKMSVDEDTVCESGEDLELYDEVIGNQMTQQQVALVRRLQMALKQERADSVLVEARVREEVCQEFSQIYADMQKDFTERLARETQLLEERAEKRLEIFKRMTAQMAVCREAREPHREILSLVSPSPRAEDIPMSDGLQLCLLRSSSMKAGENDSSEEESRLAAELHCRAQLQLEEPASQLRARAVRVREEELQMEDPPNASQTERKLREQAVQTEALPDDDRAFCRCRLQEAEWRPELLAVAQEAIEQKDAELHKRALQITELRDLVERDSGKAGSLAADLHRKEEDVRELREKLADYKTQVQRVHTDEDERLLRLKLADADKVKKQLQSDLAIRDRTIQRLETERPAEKTLAETLRLYREARQELEGKRQLVEHMRSAMLEQDETQEEMEHLLDEKLHLIRELDSEVARVKETARKQIGTDASGPQQGDANTRQLLEAKHLTERQKWQEDKMALIGQIKEAEDKRNQEIKKFAEDRERRLAQQAELEAELRAKEQEMESWRRERDTLVAALEAQLNQLLAGLGDKDRITRRLGDNGMPLPPETGGGTVGVKEDSEYVGGRPDDADAQVSAYTTAVLTSAVEPQNDLSHVVKGSSGCRRSGCPSLLESSQISMENGHASRFPPPQMEISFSPLRPDRMALRRRGHPKAVTVKITRSSRKRKSANVDKDEVEVENRRNIKVKPTLSEHQEEVSHPSASTGTHGVPGRKEVTLRKIGDFLQRSPTLIGSKAKKIMGLASASKSKRKPLGTVISSPMDVPAHPIVSHSVVVAEYKRGRHRGVKRQLCSTIGQ
ncbi:kinesin-like protein KIF20A isoform X2 [Syngnathus scovelli]|uniref:kinesin-like protein KIF20A isoform X2 n=1 Tax=Syngnathus scovelli TaxID=161590 RepID=UPI0021104CF3|nr:kinesin-like protein KIF20B isoform X2 [Syngnathus scovelli]